MEIHALACVWKGHCVGTRVESGSPVHRPLQDLVAWAPQLEGSTWIRSGQQGWLMMCMWEWGEDSGTFLGFWSEQQGDRDSILTTTVRCLCHVHVHFRS